MQPFFKFKMMYLIKSLTMVLLFLQESLKCLQKSSFPSLLILEQEKNNIYLSKFDYYSVSKMHIQKLAIKADFKESVKILISKLQKFVKCQLHLNRNLIRLLQLLLQDFSLLDQLLLSKIVK